MHYTERHSRLTLGLAGHKENTPQNSRPAMPEGRMHACMHACPQRQGRALACASPTTVPVPCASTYCTSVGAMPASLHTYTIPVC